MSTWFLDLSGRLMTFYIITKCLTKGPFTVYLGCWFDSAVLVGEAEQKEGQAAGHVVSTIRKQRDLSAGLQLTFSSVPFHVIWDQAYRWCSLHSEWVYPPQVNIRKHPSVERASKDTLVGRRCVSQVVPTLVELAIEIDLHGCPLISLILFSLKSGRLYC